MKNFDAQYIDTMIFSPSLVESGLSSVSTEAAITALGQHDQLFHRQVGSDCDVYSFYSDLQVLQLRHQQAAQQQLLQQQFQMQRQLLLDSQVPTLVTCHLTTNTHQEKAMKSHLLEYLDQHRRLEESVTPKKNEKSDVKSRLQVITVIITFPFLCPSSAGVCAAEEAA